MPRLMRSACLTDYVDVARSFGLDPYRLLEEAGLNRSCLLDPDIKISADACHRLLETSADQARAEDFGLRMAAARQLSNLGPLALAMRDAASLRDALHAGARYRRLHTDVFLFSLEERDNLAIVKVEFIGSRLSSVRQIMEMAIGVTYRAMRELLGSIRQPWPVWFSHSVPADTATHLRVFGRRVEFARDFNGILCEGCNLDAPLPAADPVMARHVKQYLEPLLTHANATVSDKVRQLVYELLPSGRCSVERMASSLGMDRRTLHRHLARDGETFSSILDAARADLAQRYVMDRRRTLSEAADMLGFSCSSAFSRWFRSKFGRSALSWRAAAAASKAIPKAAF
jgi:AraC-like DNA-binding protein